jgi:hypothetical protein
VLGRAGDVYAYSGPGYWLAGYVIERAGGRRGPARAPPLPRRRVAVLDTQGNTAQESGLVRGAVS